MVSVSKKSVMIVFTFNMMAMFCTLFSDFKNLNTSEQTKIDLCYFVVNLAYCITSFIGSNQ